MLAGRPAALRATTARAPRALTPPPALLPARPQSQKQAVRGQLDAARKTRENVRASLRDLKSNMKFTTGAPGGVAGARRRRCAGS